jgi:hypothetical protein
MSIENAWQQKLDRIARVNEESWECENCQNEFDVDSLCDHSGNIHTMCFECCEALKEDREMFGPLEKDDLD